MLDLSRVCFGSADQREALLQERGFGPGTRS